MTAWATVEQVRERAVVPADVTDAQLERAIDGASAVLQGLSGRSPAREVTVRPEQCPCGVLLTRPVAGDAGATSWPAAAGTGPSPYWWRVGPDLAVGDRSCAHELVLPDNPVVSIVQVLLDGAVVDPSGYELVDANVLRRKPVVGLPWTRRLEVTYTTGAMDEAALLAVATLAAELAKAGAGKPCNLPQRVTSITRQGVSFALLDPQTFLDGGRTGLYVVDLFLAASARPRRRSGIASPGSPRFDRLRG